MRSWIILIELAFSIILLTFFFLYTYYSKSSNYNIYSFDPNNLIYLNSSCNNNLYIYEIVNLTNNNITICYFGKQVNSTYIQNHEPIFEYLYAGQNYFNPYILIIFK
ncbi:MAG: hypothetical protein RXO65_01815 [Candidatus Nanopusillus acidilobi]|nr:hypothetical protein [Candidatus Nanopusillus sp.]